MSSEEPISYSKGIDEFERKYLEMIANDTQSGNMTNDYIAIIKTLTDLTNVEKAALLTLLYRNEDEIRKDIVAIFQALQFENLETENDSSTLSTLYKINEAYKADHPQNGFLSEEINSKFRQILSPGNQTDNSEATRANASPSDRIPPPPKRAPPLSRLEKAAQLSRITPPESTDQVPQTTAAPPPSESTVEASHVTASQSESTTQYNNPIVKWLAHRMGDNNYGTIDMGQSNHVLNRAFMVANKRPAMPATDFGDSAKKEISRREKIAEQMKQKQRSSGSDKAEFSRETARYAMELINDLKQDVFTDEFDKFLANKAKGKDDQPLNKVDIDRIKREIFAGYFMATINQIFPTGEMSANEKNYNQSMQRIMMTIHTQLQKQEFSNHDQLYNSVVSIMGEKFKKSLQETLNNYQAGAHPFEAIKSSKEFYELGERANEIMQDMINELPISVKKIQLQKEFNQSIVGKEPTAANHDNEHLQKKISELPPSLNKVRLQYEFNTQLMGASSLRNKVTSALSSVVGVLRERVTGNKSEGASEATSTNPTGTSTAGSTVGTSENQSKKSTASSFWKKLFEPVKRETRSPNEPAVSQPTVSKSAAKQSPISQPATNNNNEKSKWEEKRFIEKPDVNLQYILSTKTELLKAELNDLVRGTMSTLGLNLATQTIAALLNEVNLLSKQYPGEINKKHIMNTLDVFSKTVSVAIKAEEEKCIKKDGANEFGKPQKESEILVTLKDVNKLFEKQGIQPPSVKIAAAATPTLIKPDASGPIEIAGHRLPRP